MRAEYRNQLDYSGGGHLDAVGKPSFTAKPRGVVFLWVMRGSNSNGSVRLHVCQMPSPGRRPWIRSVPDRILLIKLWRIYEQASVQTRSEETRSQRLWPLGRTSLGRRRIATRSTQKPKKRSARQLVASDVPTATVLQAEAQHAKRSEPLERERACANRHGARCCARLAKAHLLPDTNTFWRCPRWFAGNALPGRLELPTLRLTASRSNQLSYGSSCALQKAAEAVSMIRASRMQGRRF